MADHVTAAFASASAVSTEPLDEAVVEVPLVQRFFAPDFRSHHAEAYAVYAAGASMPTHSLTWEAWRARSRAMAAHLVHVGVNAGDRVAILAGNRPIWPIADVAVQAIGAVGVGLAPTSTPAQLDALLNDSGARWLITDDAVQAQRLAADSRGVAPRLDGVVLDVRNDSGTAGWLRDNDVANTLEAFVAEGEGLLTSEPRLADVLQARLAAISPDDLAAIIYTSGSTGVPKGACISHRYLAASAASVAQRLGLSTADRGISFLPYSHAAERIFGQCTRMLVGMSAALVEHPADLFSVAAHYEPTLFGALPRIFERLYEAAEVAEHGGGDARDALVSRIGAHVRLATSGGAALPVAVAERLDALGLRILGAYGQTEHLCVAMNTPDAPRFDTVGPPMPGTRVRVASDGELLVARSALTFSGYWQREADTAAAFTDDGAWLRTGDQAAVLADGALRITGRVKDVLALSTGRKVSPLPIEALLSASPFIAHAVVHGEGRKYVTALLTLRQAVVQQWAEQQGIEDAWPALASNARLRALLAAHVEATNATLARPDQVQAFVVTAEPFTVENGLLTATMKVVRRAVDARFRVLFDALYESGGGGP